MSEQPPPVATLRPDWAMPPKPAPQCACGAEIIAEAYVKFEDDDDKGGWVLIWSCGAEEARCLAEFGEIPWPFVEDIASELDLRVLGFEVTEEWDD